MQGHGAVPSGAEDDVEPRARRARTMHKVNGVNPSFDAIFTSPPRATIILIIDKLNEVILRSSICSAVSPLSFLADSSMEGHFNIFRKILIDFFAGILLNACIRAVFPFSSKSLMLNLCFSKTSKHFSTLSASP